MNFYSFISRIRLSPFVIWYFLIKLYLFKKGSITLDIPYNLLFLCYCIMPFPEKFENYRGYKVVKPALALVLALSLLWHDSWLPPIIEAGVFLNSREFHL